MAERVRAYITLFGPVGKDSNIVASQSKREVEFDYDSGIPGLPLEGAQGKALAIANRWIEAKGAALYYGALVTRILVQHYPR